MQLPSDLVSGSATLAADLITASRFLNHGFQSLPNPSEEAVLAAVLMTRFILKHLKQNPPTSSRALSA